MCRWSDSLYVRLRAELPGGTRVRHGAQSSLLPCRGDVLDLLLEIDAGVGGWELNGKSTPDRLHVLVGRGWRPQDCAVIGDMSARIEGGVLSAAELLAEHPRVYLHDTACPRCNALHAYRDNAAGESMRGPALRVSGLQVRGVRGVLVAGSVRVAGAVVGL